MLHTLKQPQTPEILLKHFLCLSLFCPLYASYFDSVYSPDIIVGNIFAALYILSLLLRKEVHWPKRLLWLLIPALALFNIVSAYVNLKELKWYAGQINVSVSFLFFLVLAGRREQQGDSTVLDFLLKLVLISNLIGLIPYFFHYYGLSVFNGQVYLDPVDGRFDEHRYNWIYVHKSEYAFMLVLFLALIVTYRHRFPKKWMYYAGILIMAAGLLISHARTSMLAALFIFAGAAADSFRKSPDNVRKKFFPWVILFLIVITAMLWNFARDRDLLSLGSRTYIWKAAINEIRENPYGIGRLCGFRSFPVSAWPWNAYNCHNVFLNWMLQFSIPAGLLCTAMIGVIVFASVWRKPCFLTIGIWLSLLIPMNMDWCLLIQQMSMFLLVVYFLFFFPENRGDPCGDNRWKTGIKAIK